MPANNPAEASFLVCWDWFQCNKLGLGQSLPHPKTSVAEPELELESQPPGTAIFSAAPEPVTIFSL